MDTVQQRAAAKQFVTDWTGHGDEKQDAQNFWRQLLQKVFGVEDPEKAISFEYKVKNDQTNTTIFIDGYIHNTSVLIEQKSFDVDLSKGYRQSDGSMLTPFQQARRYAGLLPHNMNPRWIVVSNFQEFRIHNMNQPNAEPEIVKLSDFEKEYTRLNFLVDTGDENLKKEMELSLKAGELVGRIHDRFLEQYNDPMAKHTQRSLNILCVRLVFCLYAEDAGMFGAPDAFSQYISQYEPKDIRRALIDLFKVLDTPYDQREELYLSDDLAAFPYVNGGLFQDENIVIPRITDTIRDVLLRSSEFNWSEISPTIFGAVFESTLNPETRRSGGMHYTSIENIHKVIDPLFLDDLKQEFARIKTIAVAKEQKRQLSLFHDKLASLKFLDPAAGSGNFLTETYLCLRRLENEVISLETGGQISMGEAINPIKVSISQFYGIEINDFAVTVAKTALWIAESQMMKETEDIVHMTLDFLPLKTNATIVEGNALRLNWGSIVPKTELSFLMGNPPFVGYSLQTESQKADILSIYVDEKGKPYSTAGKIDYVAGWYFRAAQFMQGTAIRTAFVSTNSITQGEQVASVWKPLYDRFNVHIDFAHRTFQWDSEASIKAHVHCVIVGFSNAPSSKDKVIYVSGRGQVVGNINAYLVEAPDVFIDSRSKPLCDVPLMTTGNRPADGGHLIIEADEYDEFVSREPDALPYIKRLIGSAEFINNKKRWCLWLVGVSPAELRRMPLVMERVELCKTDRENAPDAGRRKLAEKPALFREINNPDSFIVVPATSSERRKYIPMGFMGSETIATNAVITIPDATIYHFGILESNVHMAWVRTVCGRLKSDYRYSKDIVYNNYPWPTPTEAQKQKIEQTAQEILDARALYPDSSLADLYDERVMPPELRTAHQKNDRAVMEAYGFWGKLNSESECVAELMKKYQALTTSQA